MNGLADVQIARFLAENSYHPRSSRHGDELCRLFLADLLAQCPAFASAADRNEIVFKTNFTIDPTALDHWNADLVVGPPLVSAIPDPASVGSVALGDARE